MTHAHQSLPMILSLKYVKTLQHNLPACRHLKNGRPQLAYITRTLSVGSSHLVHFSTCFMFPWKGGPIRSSKNFDPSVEFFVLHKREEKKMWLTRIGH